MKKFDMKDLSYETKLALVKDKKYPFERVIKLIDDKSYDDIILKIVDRLKNNIEPSIIGLFEVNVLIYNEKHYIKIEVASGIEKPYYVKSSKQKIYKTRR